MKETEHTVSYALDRSFRVRRQNKVGKHETVFNTWCEAHATLLAQARQDVHNAHAHVRSAESALRKVEEMQKPLTTETAHCIF